MGPSTLRGHYPWASSPLIASAPMGGFAGGSYLDFLVTHITAKLAHYRVVSFSEVK